MIQPVRSAALAATLLVFATAGASAQRGSRGTMTVPRVVTAPGTTSSAPAPSSGRMTGSGPRYPSPGYPSAAPRRAGDLPRLVTTTGRPPGIAYTTGSGGGSRYNPGRFPDRGTRYWRPGYSRWGIGAGCSFGCVRAGVHSGGFFGSFLIGSPFAIPFFVPYVAGSTFERYDETVVQPYAPEVESSRGPSKLIVIGAGTGGGGDALTIETIADSVRLNWLGAGRPAREIVLFVADSAQRRLATRSASPSAPTATFEVTTLSSPVAYAGVAVTYMDGVTSITLVPYRGGAAAPRR